MSIDTTHNKPKTVKKAPTTPVNSDNVENTTPKLDNGIKITPKKTKGLKPKHRKMAVEQADKRLQGNQWQSTPQQTAFMQAWVTPGSSTFGNAYQSAILAGYSTRYAQLIATPSVANKWLSEYKNKLNLTDEHIKQGISELAISSKDSRSPDDTRLKAYETLARIHNMLDNRGAITVVNVQPILGGKSAPDIIDQVD